MNFCSPFSADVNKARRLMVLVVDDCLVAMKKDQNILNSMENPPPSLVNMGIIINFSDRELSGEEILCPLKAVMMVPPGRIYYDIDNPKNPRAYIEIHSESFEEAKRILEGESK